MMSKILNCDWLISAAWIVVCAAISVNAQTTQPSISPVDTKWAAMGWGGGSLYWAAAFHPTKDGVIYLAGDCNGVFKTEDHGQHWRIINNGIADYGVYSLAVDPSSPDTVFAATQGGLCKSIDAGEHWNLLPGTDRSGLRITGERNRTIRSIAVDPTHSNIVYAGSPNGKIYKSQDGGQSWSSVYEKAFPPIPPDMLRVQFGKANDAIYGGFWVPLKLPDVIAASDVAGIGFSFTPKGTVPSHFHLRLINADGGSYLSKNLNDLFNDKSSRDVVLTVTDFVVDPDFKSKNPEKAASYPAVPDWSAISRVDLSCVGEWNNEASIGLFTRFFFAATRTSDGRIGSSDHPILVTARDFATDKKINSYSNLRVGDPAGSPILSVCVSPADPTLVAAATTDSGLLISGDAGHTWRTAEAPQQSSSIAFPVTDLDTIYAGFGKDGVWKSLDKGLTWSKSSLDLPKGFAIREVVVDPANSQNVYAVSSGNWNGTFYGSHDGGKTWYTSNHLKTDLAGDPTLPGEASNGATATFSMPTNLTINPRNPQELFFSANWRCGITEDAGKSWDERDGGADNTCFHDIRFHNGRVFAAAMDEGVFASGNDGQSWNQLWPLSPKDELSGHYWRLAIDDVNGAERIISTSSPWVEKHTNQVVLSNDGGKTFHIARTGLPDYLPRNNTMWGRGFARAMVVDPNDSKIVYLAIDGDPGNDTAGGGIFKSADGGESWTKLPGQPKTCRMFYGLAVDPIDSKRLYFATCANDGGLYRSEDGGNSWKKVFAKDDWVFNVMITSDGTVFCPGKDLWRSTDHGQSWKQITQFKSKESIVGLETRPEDPNTIWLSLHSWDDAADGGVFKTIDGGKNWQDITGDLPYRKPLILRFDPATNELWAGGVGIYKTKQ